MKNGYENNSFYEKVVILLPKLQVTCTVTPIEYSYCLVFHYRLVCESGAITKQAVPDETFELTKKSAKEFSDKVLCNIYDCCSEDDISFDGDILSKCVAYSEEQVAEILSLAQDAAIESRFKFKALAVPGYTFTEDMEIQVVYLEMNLNQFTVE